MDASGFEHWLNIWYTEIRKISEGPWCFLMDNCGGYGVAIAYDRLKVVFLPKKSTAKHQPLDLGIIAYAKIRYISTLLRSVLSDMEKHQLTNEHFPSRSSKGCYGIREGQLPHVADAIVMFNDAWSTVSRLTVLKFWVKSQCLDERHTQCFNSLIQNLTAADDVDIDLTVPDSTVISESCNVVDQDVAHSLHTLLTGCEFLEDVPRTPLHEIVEEVRSIELESQLLHILNSTVLFDAQTQKDDVLSDFFFDLYEESHNNYEASESA